MAQMIPDRLPSRASRGEQHLFAILQSLPESYIVYYEPVVSNRYPDFVVIAPDMGLLLIEVKGWYSNDLLGGDAQEIHLRERGTEKRERHPLRQAREYQHMFMDECHRAGPAVQALLFHAQGTHQGHFVFPFGHLAILSNITAAQLADHAVGDLSVVFPPQRVVTRDELLHWKTLAPGEIQAELRRYFDPYWEIPPLSPEQVDALRAVLHPEVRLATRPDSESLATLDLRQEQHARNIGSGHRIIYGVAGSGKTVLLIARARLLSQQSPETAVLVLCFNVCLAVTLHESLRDCKNVHVFHFDKWAKHNGIPRRWSPEAEQDDTLGQRLLAHLEAGYGDARKYDAVFIDEAQDFVPSWFRCALAAMNDPNEGDLLIVGDRHQGLYGDRVIVWKELGIQAQGRSVSKKFDLDRNYRNTREILELAAAFAQPGEDQSEESFALVPVDPALAFRCNGIKPLLITAGTRAEECARAVEWIATLLTGRDPRFAPALSPSDIGVLYPWLPSREETLMEAFLSAIEQFAPVVRLTKAGRERVREEGVKVGTIHASKGLQYRAVIVLWADRLPGLKGTPKEDARLMYVALTRAEDFLFLTHSGPSEFIRLIRQSGKVECHPAG
jgi:hypothetical protein